MATLGQVGEVMTEQLRERVDRLASAVEDSGSDFGEIASLADAVGEFADSIAELYVDLERRLLGGGDGDEREPDEPQRRRAPKPQSNADEVTKEELLEQARELHVEGRSSMTKEELAEAVEAEEGVTKEELLERAREANIEGRSSMSKEDLREALHAAGA